MMELISNDSTGRLKIFVRPGREAAVQNALSEKLSAADYQRVLVVAGEPPVVRPAAASARREDIAQGVKRAGEFSQAAAQHPEFLTRSAGEATIVEGKPGEANSAGPRPALTVSAPPRRRGHNVPPTPEDLAKAEKIDWDKVRAEMAAKTREGEIFKSWAGVGGTGVVTVVIGVVSGILAVEIAPALILGGFLMAAWGYGKAWKSARKITKEKKEEPKP